MKAAFLPLPLCDLKMVSIAFRASARSISPRSSRSRRSWTLRSTPDGPSRSRSRCGEAAHGATGQGGELPYPDVRPACSVRRIHGGFGCGPADSSCASPASHCSPGLPGRSASYCVRLATPVRGERREGLHLLDLHGDGDVEAPALIDLKHHSLDPVALSGETVLGPGRE